MRVNPSVKQLALENHSLQSVRIIQCLPLMLVGFSNYNDDRNFVSRSLYRDIY